MLSSMVYGNPPMEKRMLKICILLPVLLLDPLVCGQAVDLRDKNLTHITESRTWEEAQTYCRQHHTDLVTIRDEKETYLKVIGWIGLYKDSDSKWKWSRGNEIANFTNWDDNYPDSGKNCAYKRHDETVWRSDECDDDQEYTCYDERLILVKQRKTWEAALRHCRELEVSNVDQSFRYDLATLVSEDDHVYAKEKAQESTDEVWTGLRYLGGHWVWANGHGVQYTDIKSCTAEVQSGEHSLCGVLPKRSDKNFSMKNCAQKRNFLCFKKP